MQTESSRPPYFAAALAAAVVLGVYLATLAPTTAFWDTSEYIAAAKVLGIPHPPGNPLFTLMAHVFALLPLAASYAERVNLFAAVTSATAAGLWFLVAERWLRPVVPVKWARYGAAFAGIFVSAMSWTVWNQSTVNEKVYTVSLLSIAIVMWLCVHWGDEPEGPRRDRWLVLIAYVLALSSTNHMMGVLAAPAVAVYVLWTDWRVILKPWLWVAVIAGGGGRDLDQLHLPADPGGAVPAHQRGRADRLLQPGAERRPQSRAVRQAAASASARPTSLSQFQNYWQYWSWQFARDWGGWSRIATAIFTTLGLGGFITYWRTNKRNAAMVLVFFFTLVPLLVYYLNFKYGYSMHPDQPELPREVRERDYFFVASFAAWGLLVAGGIGGLMRFIADSMKKGDGKAGWIAASPVLLLGLIPLFGNHATASRAHETAARDFAVDLLESVEPYGILITAGDNDTFPLWYAQEVEGVRPDVTLANLSLMNTRWHLRQLRRRQMPAVRRQQVGGPLGQRHQRRPAGGKSVQRWTHPTEPVFGFTEAQLDSLPEYMQVQKGAGSAGGQRADPLRRRLPHAAGPRRRRHHPAEPRQAADLLLLERRRVSRPDAGPEPVPGDAGDGPEAHDRPGHHRQRFTGGQPGARADGLSAHREPAVERLSLEGDRAPAAARLGRSAVVVDPAAVCGALSRTGGDAAHQGDLAKAAEADSIAQAIRINLQPIH